MVRYLILRRFEPTSTQCEYIVGILSDDGKTFKAIDFGDRYARIMLSIYNYIIPAAENMFYYDHVKDNPVVSDSYEIIYEESLYLSDYILELWL